MKRFLLTTAVLLAIGATTAPAQTQPAPSAAPPAPFTPPDPIHITVSRQQLQLLGQGLSELPLKTAAPMLNELNRQIQAIDQAASEAAQAKAKEDADKVAAADKAQPAPKPDETPAKK